MEAGASRVARTSSVTIADFCTRAGGLGVPGGGLARRLARRLAGGLAPRLARGLACGLAPAPRATPVPDPSPVQLRPSPTLSPTDPVPRGLLTLCPAASSAPPLRTGPVGDVVGEGLACVCARSGGLCALADALSGRGGSACCVAAVRFPATASSPTDLLASCSGTSVAASTCASVATPPPASPAGLQDERDWSPVSSRPVSSRVQSPVTPAPADAVSGPAGAALDERCDALASGASSVAVGAGAEGVTGCRAPCEAEG